MRLLEWNYRNGTHSQSEVILVGGVWLLWWSPFRTHSACQLRICDVTQHGPRKKVCKLMNDLRKRKGQVVKYIIIIVADRVMKLAIYRCTCSMCVHVT